MAVADSAERRDEAFSTAVVLYAVAGVACGALVAALGVAATALIDLPGWAGRPGPRRVAAARER